MGAPTIYSWSDAGAPAYLGSANLDKINHTLNILKACLVDGYGSKPAAGWSLIGHITGDGSTNKAGIALTNSRGTGVAKLTQQSSSDAWLRVMAFDAMTDYENGLSGFSREKHITNHYSGFGYGCYMRGLPMDGTQGWWHLIANEHTAILIQTWNTAAGAHYSQAVTYIGEFDPLASSMNPGDAGNFVVANRNTYNTQTWRHPWEMIISNSRFHNGTIKQPGEAGSYWSCNAKYEQSIYSTLITKAPHSLFHIDERSSSPHVSTNQLIGRLYAMSMSIFRVTSGDQADNHSNGRTTGSIQTLGGKSFMFVNEYFPTLVDLSPEAWP